MPKRIAPDERPYSPVQEALARDVLTKHRDRPLSVVAEPEDRAPVERVDADADPDADPDGSPIETPAQAQVKPAKAPPAPVAFPAPADPGMESDTPPRTAKKRDLTREKRMLLTRDEERELDRLIEEISDELGVRVKVSNVMRASVTLLFNVREELAKQCRRAKFSKRPRNSEPTEIANFEENLARLFDSAVRNTRHRD